MWDLLNWGKYFAGRVSVTIYRTYTVNWLFALFWKTRYSWGGGDILVSTHSYI